MKPRMAAPARGPGPPLPLADRQPRHGVLAPRSALSRTNRGNERKHTAMLRVPSPSHPAPCPAFVASGNLHFLKPNTGNRAIQHFCCVRLLLVLRCPFLSLFCLYCRLLCSSVNFSRKEVYSRVCVYSHSISTFPQQLPVRTLPQ